MNEHLKPILEASYAKNKDAKNMLEKQNYKLDKDLSTREARVFVDEHGTQTYQSEAVAMQKTF